MHEETMYHEEEERGTEAKSLTLVRTRVEVKEDEEIPGMEHPAGFLISD